MYVNVSGVEPNAPLVQWFWEVMEELSGSERALFLRFVWGRTRLPRAPQDPRQRDFVLQVSASIGYRLDSTYILFAEWLMLFIKHFNLILFKEMKSY